MIITHASHERITEVKDIVDYDLPYKGCLFFGDEGNTYNLNMECKFQYNLEVENIIRTKRFFYEHDTNEEAVQEVFEMMRNDLCMFDADDSVLADLLDETTSIHDDEEFNGDYAHVDWSIQQFQGILAHKLGYDCAESFDEQGTVYISYCVGREMQEVKC